MRIKISRNLMLPVIIVLSLIVVSPHVVHPASAQVSQNIISQLESDINDAKNTANNAAQNYARVAQSFQEVKDTTDRLYMISMVGIGLGAAGIIVAVVAITRNKQQT